MIWRLIKDFKSDIVLHACFDSNICLEIIYIYTPHAWICRKFITNVPHIHNIASQTTSKAYFQTFQSLQLTNIMINPISNNFHTLKSTHINIVSQWIVSGGRCTKGITVGSTNQLNLYMSLTQTLIVILFLSFLCDCFLI